MSRAYGTVVAVWVLAALVAVAGTLARRGPAEAPIEAMPPLDPSLRAPSSFETEGELPAALRGVVAEPVEGTWEGPGGHSFMVVARSGAGTDPRVRMIGREAYPLTLRLDGAPGPEDCTTCHEGRRISGRRSDAGEAVHQNIQPVHPAQTGAECLDCHVVDDVARLDVGRGETAGFTHAYRLCAQCHYTPVESWAKGAHGKRLVGWRGQRIVFGCAECHDPHRPATESRTPYPGPLLPEPLRAEAGHANDEAEGGH